MPSNLPSRVTSGSRSGDAFNKLRENARSHEPIQSPGVLTGHTIHGVSREAEIPIAPYGSEVSGANLYIVKSAMPNYLVCRTYDGTTEGSEDVNVCKPFSAQQPSEETVATILINYTYSPGPDALNDFRLAESDDFNIGISEQQVVIPYWATTGTNAIIVAIGIDHTGVDDEDGNEIKLIEVSSRCWAGPAF